VADKNNKKPAKKKAKDTFEEESIFKPPTIVRDPQSRQAKLGSRVVLRVEADGKPLPSYQWFHNGKKISGATSDRLSLVKVRRPAIGAYHCEVKNFVGKATSRAAMLSFFTARIPKLVIGPELSKLHEGKPFTLTVISPSAADLKDFKVFWMFNGMRIKGATGLTLNISGVKKKYEGEYKAMIATGSGIETSNVAKLVVKPAKVVAPAEAAATEAMPVEEEQKSLEDILAEQPTSVLETPAKPTPSWDEFNFNPEDDGTEETDEELVAPAEGSEQFGNTSPGTPGAPRSPISQLGTQDLIRELQAQDALEDPSSLISAAEVPVEGEFDLSGLLDATPVQEDPSGLIEMLTSREAPAPEPVAEAQPKEENEDDNLIMDWGLSPAVKPVGPEVPSMAAAPEPAPAPAPKRANPALAQKKTFLEQMLRQFQNRASGGKRAA
jgi:hypothetical protein